MMFAADFATALNLPQATNIDFISFHGSNAIFAIQNISSSVLDVVNQLLTSIVLLGPSDRSGSARSGSSDDGEMSTPYVVIAGVVFVVASIGLGAAVYSWRSNRRRSSSVHIPMKEYAENDALC